MNKGGSGPGLEDDPRPGLFGISLLTLIWNPNDAGWWVVFPDGTVYQTLKADPCGALRMAMDSRALHRTKSELG